jgi:predicted enzyme related to lactoylglutathione lyase
MHTIPRFAAVLALACTAGLGLSPARAETLPPLNSPASPEHKPGKFVWADLFTSDPAAATAFYTKLFGWNASVVFQRDKSYTVFTNAGHPVAGLVTRSAAKSKESRPSRWIGYIAVDDIAATLAAATGAGGKVHAPARNFPDRGQQAIIADNEGSPVGLLQSASGDSADNEPAPGEWNWFELYANNPEKTSAFYGKVFDYAVTPDARTERKDDFLLSRGDDHRAGVAPLPDTDDAQPGWLGVIRVASVDATVAQVTGLGGRVLLFPRPAAYESRFAIIADPTGGVLGLIEYVDNANPANASEPAPKAP